MNIAPVEPFPSLNSFFRDHMTAERQTAQIEEYITANEASSGVIVMVTHQVNITALSDIFPQSGSAANHAIKRWAVGGTGTDARE